MSQRVERGNNLRLATIEVRGRPSYLPEWCAVSRLQVTQKPPWERTMAVFEWLRSHALALPTLAKFALTMAIIVGVPRLSKRLRLPAVVGFLLCGVVFGPHVLGVFGLHPVIADFSADLGKLMLMFFAGLEIDLNQFRRARNRSMTFGLATTSIPLALGIIVGLGFGYSPVAAVVLGSLMASHTLLALSIL